MAQNTITAQMGQIDTLADTTRLFEVIRRQIAKIAHAHYPNDEQYTDRHNMQKQIEADFMHVLMTYVCWSRPTKWMLDFCSETAGEFGILFTGGHTCLVQCNSTGYVSAHS